MGAQQGFGLSVHPGPEIRQNSYQRKDPNLPIIGTLNPVKNNVPLPEFSETPESRPEHQSLNGGSSERQSNRWWSTHRGHLPEETATKQQSCVVVDDAVAASGSGAGGVLALFVLLLVAITVQTASF